MITSEPVLSSGFPCGLQITENQPFYQHTLMQRGIKKSSKYRVWSTTTGAGESYIEQFNTFTNHNFLVSF